MSAMDKIKRKYGGGICRSCINKEYDVNLQPRDCKIYPRSGICPVCKLQCNIVGELSFSGKMKMVGKG